ncbi:MAG TPA: FtsX-like permease family protein [Clostridia bacterium]|nr:FtsX-like permease family protein [Clostridia bacterium]
MLSSRWHKLIGDLSVNKMRTVFVILAICIGVFGISVVANSYSILLREMDKNYMNTNPSSAVLWTDPLNDSYIQKIRDLPYIKDAEKRGKVIGRVQVGSNEWKDIWLFVINDFDDIRLDTFASEKGKAIPDSGEILLERKALSVAKAEINQSINVKIPDGNITTLKLAGTVHAPGLAPAWMEGYAYGYITSGTLKLLGGEPKNTELKIIVAEDGMNTKHIRDNVYLLKEYLEKDGIKVARIDIPRPGKHPHYDQMAILLFLMEIFGLLALILSGILVVNIITAIIDQQTRQIGIMKAIGASSLQISGLYQGMVLILAFAALLISIPAGVYAGRGYAWMAAEMLNFNIYSYSIPAYIFIIEFALGLLVPLLTAGIPIARGSGITVYEAIKDYGINQEKYSSSTTNRLPKILGFLPRPFLLSLRNTFRRKGRLIFTILVMAAGGTGFIVAMNIYASMYYTVDEKINSLSYDIQVTFDSAQPVSIIENAISEIPGAVKVEAWGGASASHVYKDGTTGNSFNIVAPPSSTKLMSAPPLYNGRWLEPNDKNAIVINQRLLTNEPDMRVGNEIILRINQRDTKWKVVGISKELLGQPAAYVNSEYLSQVLQKEGYARNAVIVTSKHSSSSQSEIAKLLEQKMAEKGMHVSSLIKIADYREAIENHLLFIATFLIMMSVLVVIVGGLGLAITISINTLERTREIGIMRAVGASTNSITGIVVTEGVIIGILSWFISMVLSWPLSRFVSYKFGMIFFEAPLEFAASISGFVIWLAIVILFAALASFYPSWKASQMPVRNALSYE